MMKKLTSLLVTLALLMSLAPAALADTTIDPFEDRKIKTKEVTVNEMIEGQSPITGLAFADMEQPEGFAGQAVTGRYMPMMVQIDNANGGVGARAPWGAAYADIIYETPLYKKGDTRLSFIFSDLIPDSVGPIRSARMGHVWLREEWDAGFLYYGQQEHEEANAYKEVNKLHVWEKGLAFSGLVSESKPWKKYYTRRKDLPSPHDVDANVAAMYGLIDPVFEPRNHTFLFTDERPIGDDAVEIAIETGADTYGSRLVYDVDTHQYLRFMRHGEELIPYADSYTGEQLGFSNVIVQFAQVHWVQGDAPVTFHVGKQYYNGKGEQAIGGNADFFMNGVHVKGYWQRDTMESRTVFYTADGQELQLQRGKTLVVVADQDRWQVSYK